MIKFKYFTGTYLNGTLNSCEPCKKGTYQPESQQTTCIQCDANTSTKGPAAVSGFHCLVNCDVYVIYNVFLFRQVKRNA